MDYQKIIIGILYGLTGQIGTFMQLQASYKFGWTKKYEWLIILASLPLGWLYVRSVRYFIDGFGGQIWPSRLIGFGVGVIVFTILTILLFKEPLNLKNAICLGLGFCIILVQLFIK
jgi:hypothetical protein